MNTLSTKKWSAFFCFTFITFFMKLFLFQSKTKNNERHKSKFHEQQIEWEKIATQFCRKANLWTFDALTDFFIFYFLIFMEIWSLWKKKMFYADGFTRKCKLLINLGQMVNLNQIVFQNKNWVIWKKMMLLALNNASHLKMLLSTSHEYKYRLDIRSYFLD